MKIQIILALLLASNLEAALSEVTKKEILAKLSHERYFPYQDIIINNEVIFKGVGPDCQSRYDAINSALNKYDRPIKVLDIGASNGYFSLRIAHDYDALCVMSDLSDRLRDICVFNDQLPNLIYLKKEFTLADLELLLKDEHFDVVLALNVVHHMEPWKEILDVIFELGDMVIIETPPANDDRSQDNPSVPAIENYLMNKVGGKIIAETPRAAANNFDGIITSLNAEENLLAKKEYTPNAYAKMFCFENKVTSEETPSFKLSTFNSLNGIYPSVESFNDQDEIVLK